MVKKKDVISEVDDKVKELVDLMVLDKTIQCDAGKNDYTRCVLRKAMVHVELRKRLDKLIYELAFGYVTTEIIDEKEMIEQVVNHFVEVGLINEDRWMKAVQNALRYVNRIDGMDVRVKVRRVAEEMDKVFEEEGFR